MKNSFILVLTILVVAAALCILGCDIEDTAEDVAKDQVDTSFDKDATLELEPIEASDDGGAQTADMDCGTTSVNEELAKHDIEEGDDVDIKSVDLKFIEAAYAEAVWEPVEVTHVTCVMTLMGDIGTVTIVEESVDKNSKDWSQVTLSDDAQQFINYYLDNRDEEFGYCVECTDADSYSVRWYVKIGVTVKGEII